MIARLNPDELPQALEDLAHLLYACVHDGASVGFILPFPLEAARRYWSSQVFPKAEQGALDLFVARDANRIVGTVHLALASMPNQLHRADVCKLLVHPNARRNGIGQALMMSLEATAKENGRTLLVLDTRSNDPSQRLYQNLGFRVSGEIPGYCRNPELDRLEPTTYMYKSLT